MPSRNERGAALLLALLALALLAALVLRFDAEARRELNGAVAFRDEVKARTLTHAAAEAARALLKEAARDKRRRNQTWDDLTDLWAMPVQGFQLGDGEITGRLTDERG